LSLVGQGETVTARLLPHGFTAEKAESGDVATDRPTPVSLHRCPVCQHPQTRIQRVLVDALGLYELCALEVNASPALTAKKVTTWLRYILP
jgi:hypothetical protein